MANEIKFEDIKKANETIATTNIKGKDYAEVNQRIKAFRMVYPTGLINTELVSNENGICIFRASVFDEDRNLLATGTAYEKENSSFINKTSYIENCETSAIGRALGIAGFGIDTSIASAEEVQNAMNNQNKLATKEQIAKIVEVIPKDKWDKMLNYYKIKDIKEMTYENAEKLIESKTNGTNRKDS